MVGVQLVAGDWDASGRDARMPRSVKIILNHEEGKYEITKKHYFNLYHMHYLTCYFILPSFLATQNRMKRMRTGKDRDKDREAGEAETEG